jgi:Holliday junction DNA helicase RuvA
LIASLNGTVLEKSEDEAIIEVAGVGYRVAFSILTLARLPASSPRCLMWARASR